MTTDVALFITCLSDQFYPHVGVAVTKILEHYGCRVRFPQAQTCCGQPFFNNGFHDDARDLAKRFIEVFEPFVQAGGYVVTPSGSCCAMVRQHFPHLFEGDHAWEPGLHRIVSKTFEFSEFLDRVLHVDFASLKLPAPQRTTYHYTCHMRGLGITDEPMNALKRIGSVDFVAMEKTDQCCGFGGTFAIKYPAISGAIVEDKVKCIAATQAQTTVCNEAGCAMNIAGMCHRSGVKTDVKHIAELMAEALGLNLESW